MIYLFTLTLHGAYTHSFATNANEWGTHVVSSLENQSQRHADRTVRATRAKHHTGRAILTFMALPDFTPRVGNDPKSVVIHLTTGTGMEIEWKDGHRSVYTFPFLRDACPCALCEDERTKARRTPGEPAKLAPGALPMFKPAVKALAAEAVGKYALKFSWNDNHDLGLYSWFYLREVCPCAECAAARK